MSSFLHFVLLAEVCQSFDCQIGGVVGGDVVFNQPFHGSLTAFATDEGDGNRFAANAGFLNGVINCFGNFLGISNGCFTIENSQTVNPIVGIGVFDAFVITSQASTTGDIDRVFGGAKGGHVFLEFGLNIFGSEFEG